MLEHAKTSESKSKGINVFIFYTGNKRHFKNGCVSKDNFTYSI